MTAAAGPVERLLETLADAPEQFPSALLLTASSEARLERESRRLAARLICPRAGAHARRENEPFGESCSSCRRVDAGLHPDLVTIEPEGVQIRVDRIREALAFAAGRPYESMRRVVRILRADLLGLESGNALLKALEEPGERVRWILTSARSESLLVTIRSRCTRVALPEPGLAERQRLWESRGFTGEDARELVLFAAKEEDEPEAAAAALTEGRGARQLILEALEEGLAGNRLVPLLLLAERLGPRAGDDGRLLAELLADGALASGASAAGDAVRHHAVAGRLATLSRRVSPASLREAAIAAADPPPDTRRGNRRYHYESLLLKLFASRVG
jgi:DNA polymerase-3 subunit delta'